MCNTNNSMTVASDVEPTDFGRSYYRARLYRNRQLAAAAKDPGVRVIHEAYARLYEAILNGPRLAASKAK